MFSNVKKILKFEKMKQIQYTNIIQYKSVMIYSDCVTQKQA